MNLQLLEKFADGFGWIIKHLVGAGLTGVGVVGVGWLTMSLVRGRASLHWRQTRGTVLESTVEEKSDSDGIEHRSRVVYEYRVDGCVYTSNVITYDAVSPAEAEVRATVSKYPVGAEIAVYYDPNQPANAVLQPGAGGVPFVMGLALCIVFTCIGVLILLDVL